MAGRPQKTAAGRRDAGNAAAPSQGAACRSVSGCSSVHHPAALRAAFRASQALCTTRQSGETSLPKESRVWSRAEYSAVRSDPNNCVARLVLRSHLAGAGTSTGEAHQRDVHGQPHCRATAATETQRPSPCELQSAQPPRCCRSTGQSSRHPLGGVAVWC